MDEQRKQTRQKKPRIEKVCPCGKFFYLTPGQVREKHGKYCSRGCYFKYRNYFNVSKLSHQLRGIQHWNYKGRKAKYAALHLRVQIIRGKANKCEFNKNHISKWYEWANKSGKYDDVDDYVSLCRSCHKNYDNARRR